MDERTTGLCFVFVAATVDGCTDVDGVRVRSLPRSRTARGCGIGVAIAIPPHREAIDAT